MINITFEECLVSRCAPTLAGIKAGNLFSYAADARHMNALLRHWNRQLSDKGVWLRILRRREDRNLILVYRCSALQRILAAPENISFLSERGYAGCRNADDCLQMLAVRVVGAESFPHEIGLFLGYPLHDVKGFIANKGENACCCGCWKVYARQTEAKCQFRCFHQCTRIYQKMFQNGGDVARLTIAA